MVPKRRKNFFTIILPAENLPNYVKFLFAFCRNEKQQVDSYFVFNLEYNELGNSVRRRFYNEPMWRMRGKIKSSVVLRDLCTEKSGLGLICSLS